jgi:CDP-diacylglycerol pyrophosphatase
MNPTDAKLRLAGLLAALCLTSSPALADRNALWNIVHNKCVPHVEAGGGPSPCDYVDLSGGEDKGVAMLKDIVGVAQYLLIPTKKLSGIEDAFLLTPEAPNYFAEAWAERGLLDAKLGVTLPREAVSIAINSEYARTQDQFHLHVDCLRPDVMATLAADAKTFDDTWRPMVEPLNGRIYFARRLLSADLSDARPFELLADGLEGAKAAMPYETLAVVGAAFDGKPGFILLADHAELAAGGAAEAIQDHTCAVAKK